MQIEYDSVCCAVSVFCVVSCFCFVVSVFAAFGVRTLHWPGGIRCLLGFQYVDVLLAFYAIGFQLHLAYNAPQRTKRLLG